MADLSSTKSFSDAAKKTLSVVSDQWGIFGPTFKMKLPVTDAGPGLYKIARSDWDATVGPLFERLRDNIVRKLDKIGNEYQAVANGYRAMDSAQTAEFHTLLQSFSAAADPSELAGYPGTPETNAHLRKLTDFVDVFNGPDQSVLVNRTQLQALATIARGSLEYTNEGSRVSEGARAFFGKMMENQSFRYSNGLVNALT